VSPADGVISAIGDIHNDTLIQAKGMDFSLTALLGGDESKAAPFKNGQFATVYLSPKDYHRVHMPFGGKLTGMTYVPGRLFSVNQVTSEQIPGLFARNERAVCFFDTDRGPMAVVLVGAMIVAAIDTVWAGQVAPSRQGLYHQSYKDSPTALATGVEMGRFRLGSTAIVVFGPDMMRWNEALGSQSPVRMGQFIGSLIDR
jgi:phosphatidylserine decarboxylase